MEGEWPYKLAPGVRGGEGEADDEDNDSDEGAAGMGPATVFRVSKGQVDRLAGGMDEYEEIAARRAARGRVRR